MNNKLFFLLLSLAASIKACNGPYKEMNALIIGSCAHEMGERKAKKYKEVICKLIARPIKQQIKMIGIESEYEKETCSLLKKLATRDHYIPMLRFGLRNGLVDPNIRFGAACTPSSLLNEAIYEGAYENIEVLLEFDADPNKAAWKRRTESNFKESPLFAAVYQGDERATKMLLDKKADPNKHHKRCRPLPLMAAVENYISAADYKHENKSIDLLIIATLLTYDASPDAKEEVGVVYNGKSYFSPRELAVAYGYQNILELFNSGKKK